MFFTIARSVNVSVWVDDPLTGIGRHNARVVGLGVRGLDLAFQHDYRRSAGTSQSVIELTSDSVLCYVVLVAVSDNSADPHEVFA